MKRALHTSLEINNSKEQTISNNSSKKQKLMKLISTPPPQHTPEDNNGTFSDVLTVDTPRSDDTHTLHSDTSDSDSDTVIEEDSEYNEDILAIRNQIINGREHEKTKEIDNKIFNEFIEKEEPTVNTQCKINEEKDEIVAILDNKSKGKNTEVKKDESKLLQGIVVDTADKSLSISLDAEIKCHSLIVKSNVQIVKISPKSVSFKLKKVRIIIRHQGRLVSQHNHSEYLYSILLRNGLNYIEIWVNELMGDVDHGGAIQEGPGQKYLLFITKL